MSPSILGFRIGRLLVLIGLLFGAARAAQAQPDPGATAAGPALSGVLTILWGDALDGTSSVAFFLNTTDGRRHELRVAPAVAADLWRLNGRPVTVYTSGDRGRGVLPAGPLPVVRVAPADGRAAGNDPLAGELPYLSLLCAFPDGDGAFGSSAFHRDMYGDDAPQLGHYWDDLSYGAVSLAGSDTAGPFPMPHPYAVYGIPEAEDLDRLAADCVAAADPTVDFSAFHGVNLMFNVSGAVWGTAWGGGWYGMMDGRERAIPASWLPTWAWGDVSVVAHEMGHTFGLPHSSGPYGYTYDNPYDVMSADRYPCYAHNQHDDTYGCVGQQTIGRHKQILGWLSGDDIHTAGAGDETVELDVMAGGDNSRPRLLVVPVVGVPDLFYTVEARATAGYDGGVPGAGVVIHRVDRFMDAILMDGDGNGDTTDDGVYWEVGEAFAVPDDGIAITVSAATAAGYVVDVHAAPPPPFTTCAAQEWLAMDECEALVALYEQTNGPEWSDHSGWLAMRNPCRWYGVECARRSEPGGPSDEVIELWLGGNGLEGPVPAELGDLAALRTLYLSDNRLAGPLPAALGQLGQLEWLWLGGNGLEGPIPAELGDLAALRILSLADNRFAGPLPAALGQLGQLEELWLGGDLRLTGGIPPELGDLAALRYLVIYTNDTQDGLSGPLPEALGRLEQLEVLMLSRQDLSGPLPAYLGQMPKLRELVLDGNRFTGSLPAALGDLGALEGLSVHDNQFTGLLPAALGDLGALRYLNVGNNPLSGGIPHAYLNLSQLGDFLLYGTALCRPPDAAFAAWFQALFSPHEIALCDTSLAGSDIDGAPGSVFALRGVVFPPNTPATIAVNGREIGQAMTDDYGEIAFLLDTTDAGEGRYDVTVNAGERAAFTIRLSGGRPPRAAEGEGETFAIPPGTAALAELFVPVVAGGG